MNSAGLVQVAAANAYEDCNEPSRFMRDREFKQWRNQQHVFERRFSKKKKKNPVC